MAHFFLNVMPLFSHYSQLVNRRCNHTPAPQLWWNHKTLHALVLQCFMGCLVPQQLEIPVINGRKTYRRLKLVLGCGSQILKYIRVSGDEGESGISHPWAKRTSACHFKVFLFVCLEAGMYLYVQSHKSQGCYYCRNSLHRILYPSLAEDGSLICKLLIY